ncbi:DMT family transporter [Amycolatopsis nigrescens]|uniref:DMT family transporter n=1 Tax=Amycolatopsis nigrescens TaxID=381445 RepID=UPI00035C9C56|nr:DMT family transporter [Amycolatopsis nigrescens]
MNLIGIAFAMVGAVFAALAAHMQHRAVHTTMRDAGDGTTLRLRSFSRLLRQRGWLLGLLAMTAGGTLHAVALGLAPIIVVQPVGVIAVAATALFAARAGGPRLSGRGWLAIAAIAAGVAGFVGIAANNTTPTEVTGSDGLQAGQLVAVGVAAMCLLAMATRGRVRGVAFATAAAMAYGLVSVLTRAVLQQAQHGGPLAALIASAVAIVLALVLGAWLVQQAYASAPPHTVMACITVVDPIVAVAIGIGLLGEAASISGWVAVSGSLCALLAVGGVLALAGLTEHYGGNHRPPAAPDANTRPAPEPLRVG